jgi:general stress protein YciG
MDEAKQRAIASKGGKAAHQRGTAHEFSSAEAREAGRKGGEVVSSDRDHMAEIGRKGGVAISQDRDYMARIGRKGGETVSGDRKHMADIGRSGGASKQGHDLDGEYDDTEKNAFERHGMGRKPDHRSYTN